MIIKKYCIINFNGAKRLDLNCFHHKKKNLCDMIEVLADFMVVIILQYVNVSDQHVVDTKPTQCYITH